MRFRSFWAMLLLVASAHLTPSQAQIALYEGRLPEGFAFIRFANTTPDPMDLVPAFTDPVKLGSDAAARISQYRVVENVAGKTLSVINKEGGHLDLQLVAGKFHTFLITAGGAGLAGKLVTDVTEYNQLRSKLSFYNAAPNCPTAALLLEPANQAVFTGVETATMRTRSINPVAEAKVHATCGAAKVPTLDLGELNAGALYSVWLMAPSGVATTFLAQDFIAPLPAMTLIRSAALLLATCLVPAFLLGASMARAADVCPALPSRASLPREARPEALTFPGWQESSTAIDASLAKQDRGSFRLVFVGDSITASWDPPIFQKFFGPYSPLLLGIGGDRTEGMLYRLSHSELSGLHPRVLVLLAGTNNTSGGGAPENIALGIAQILRLVHARSPTTKLLVLGLLPRGVDATDPMRLANDRVNTEIARCADDQVVFYYDAASLLLDPAGRLTDQMSFDHLHLTPTGYYKLAEGLEPEISRLMAN